MTKNILNIGIPSKGRLRKDVLNIFKKNKLNLISENNSCEYSLALWGWMPALEIHTSGYLCAIS